MHFVRVRIKWTASIATATNSSASIWFLCVMATTAKQTASNSSATSTVRNSPVPQSATHSINTNNSTDSTGSPVTNHFYHHHPHPTAHLYRSNSPGQRNDQTEHEQEHIDIIAKQISDHAEAIYQTWKARGLAPTEILNCHTINTDAFDRTITSSLKSASSTAPRRSQSPQYTAKYMPNDLTDAPHCIDTLSNTVTTNMSNTHLKKLVSTFVSEDKARQQQQQQQQQSNATRKTNILTSGTIKDALRKFENIDSAAANLRPNYVKFNSTNSSNNRSTINSTSTATTTTTATAAAPVSTATTKTSNASIAQREKSPKSFVRHSDLGHTIDTTNNLHKNVPDVLVNTIDPDKLNGKASVTSGAINNGNCSGHSTNKTSASGQGASIASNTIAVTTNAAGSRTKPETPAKPANLLSHQPSWSLRNRLKPSENGTTNSTTHTNSTPTIDKSSDPKPLSLSSAQPTPLNATQYENDMKSATLVKQNCQTITNNNHINNNNNNNNNHSSHSNNLIIHSNKSNSLMDKVLLEEERLINALKTGTILNNDELPEVTLALTNSTATSTVTVTTKIATANNISSMTNVNVTNNANSAQDQQQMATPPMPPHAAPAATANWNGSAGASAVSVASATSSSKQPTGEGNELDTVQMKMAKVRPKNDAAVPHPDNMKSGMAGKAMNTAPAVRPFLTRGSVAERVLMFEKCPEIKTLRNAPKEPNKLAVTINLFICFVFLPI